MSAFAAGLLVIQSVMAVFAGGTSMRKAKNGQQRRSCSTKVATSGKVSATKATTG